MSSYRNIRDYVCNWNQLTTDITIPLKASGVRFALISLFNGISTFVGYLMPKLSL